MQTRIKTRAAGWFAFIAAAIFIAAPISHIAVEAQSEPSEVKIEVRADRSQGAWQNIWNFWGYDEPNYTYAAKGKKLLREFAELSPDPVYIRVHNLFTSGDGKAALKWGSTNVYT